jgi:hypothetical protein
MRAHPRIGLCANLSRTRPSTAVHHHDGRREPLYRSPQPRRAVHPRRPSAVRLASS